MADWETYSVDLGADGVSEVEARVTPSGSLEWRGLPGTTFETWQGGSHRTSQSVGEQIQDIAAEWYVSTKIV